MPAGARMGIRMRGWIEQHFGVPHHAPPRRRGAGFRILIILLLVLPLAGAGTAWWLGYFDPVLQEVTRRLQTDSGVRTITQARANELQRLIASREAGLDLMARDRAKVASKQVHADAALTAATARLSSLERSRPGAHDTRGVYEWNLAYNDALAAARNASTAVKTNRSLLNGFDGRIAKATDELADARAELDGATIVP